jgi:hypothetical protein
MGTQLLRGSVVLLRLLGRQAYELALALLDCKWLVASHSINRRACALTTKVSDVVAAASILSSEVRAVAGWTLKITGLVSKCRSAAAELHADLVRSSRNVNPALGRHSAHYMDELHVARWLAHLQTAMSAAIQKAVPLWAEDLSARAALLSRLRP